MRISLRLVAVLTTLCLAGSASLAQDFILPYNKAPETAPEFWAATKYEMQLGNHNRAGEMLQRFAERLANLGEDDQNKLLLAIYDRDGLSPLLRLANLEAVRKLKTTDAAGREVALGDAVVQRMTKAIEGRLGDPARIEFFVNNLAKSPEERAFAFVQLRLAGARAVPALVKVLQNAARQREHGNVISAMVRMDRDFAPAALAALESPSEAVRSAILRVFEQRGDDRIVPYLWYFVAAPDTTPALKAQASALLAKFRSSEPQADARGKLTAEADAWYRLQRELPSGTSTLWTWDGSLGTVVAQPASKSAYADYQAMFWARKALELDPGYEPAQVLLLSAAIDRAVDAHGLRQPLAATAPEVSQLLAAAGADTLDRVLDRATNERRTGVALGAAHALGQAGDPRALRPRNGGRTALAQALAFPDQRVQFAAAEAMLNIPAKGAVAGSSRVVPVLARAIGGSGSPLALVGHGRPDAAQRLAGLFRQAGLDAEAFSTGRALIAAADEAGEASVIAIDANMPDPGLPFLLSQLAENVTTRALPILLFVENGNERAVRELAAAYPQVKVLGRIPVTAELLRSELAQLAKETTPLADDERKAMAAKAVALLEQLVTEERPGYNLNPADAALIRALNDDDLALAAARVLGRRPGATTQTALAEALLADSRTPAIRAAAAAGLRASFVRFGFQVSPEVMEALVRLGTQPQADLNLKLEIDRLTALLQPAPAQVGKRLLQLPLRATLPPAADPAKNSDGEDN